MADTYIYHGPDGYSPGGSLRFYKGQFIFTSDSTGEDFTYVNGVRNFFPHALPEIDGDYTSIRTFNKDKYGSVNHHPKSGGCMYTIRKTTYLTQGSTGQTAHPTRLYAGDVVIFGPSYPHGTRGTNDCIRMWGFKRGGRSGADVETYGLWCESGVFDGMPVNYNINTL